MVKHVKVIVEKHPDGYVASDFPHRSLHVEVCWVIS